MTVNINSVPSIECDCCEGDGKHRCRKRRHTIGYLPDDNKYGRQRRMSDEMEDRLRDIERRQTSKDADSVIETRPINPKTYKSVGTKVQHSLKFSPEFATEATEEDVGRSVKLKRDQASTVTGSSCKGGTFKSLTVKIKNALRISPAAKNDQEKDDQKEPAKDDKHKRVKSKSSKSKERPADRELSKAAGHRRHTEKHNTDETTKRRRRRFSNEADVAQTAPDNEAPLGTCTPIFAKCRAKKEESRKKRSSKGMHNNRDKSGERRKRKRRPSDADEKNEEARTAFATKSTDAKTQAKIRKFRSKSTKTEERDHQEEPNYAAFSEAQIAGNSLDVVAEDNVKDDDNVGRSTKGHRRSIKSKVPNVKHALKIRPVRKNKRLQSEVGHDVGGISNELGCACDSEVTTHVRRKDGNTWYVSTQTRGTYHTKDVFSKTYHVNSDEVPPSSLGQRSSYDTDIYIRNKTLPYYKNEFQASPRLDESFLRGYKTAQLDKARRDSQQLHKNNELRTIFPGGHATTLPHKRTEHQDSPVCFIAEVGELDRVEIANLSHDIIIEDFERVNKDLKVAVGKTPERDSESRRRFGIPNAFEERNKRPDTTLEFLKLVNDNLKSWRCSASSIEPNRCDEIKEAMRKLAAATEKIIWQYRNSSRASHSPQTVDRHTAIDVTPDENVGRYTAIDVPLDEYALRHSAIDVPRDEYPRKHTAIDVPPDENAYRHTAIDVPPDEYPRRHVAINVPPDEYPRRHIAINVPPDEYPRRYTAIDVSPDDDPYRHNAIVVPPDESTRRHTTIGVPPDEYPRRHTAIVIPPDENAHGERRLSDSTQMVLDRYRLTQAMKKHGGIYETFPNISQSQVDEVVREEYEQSRGTSVKDLGSRKISDKDNQTRFDDTHFKGGPETSSQNYGIIRMRRAGSPDDVSGDILHSKDVVVIKEIAKVSSSGKKSTGHLKSQHSEGELKNYVYEDAFRRQNERKVAPNVSNVDNASVRKNVSISENVSTYIDPVLLGPQETEAGGETKYGILPYHPPLKRKGWLCPAKKILVKDKVNHIDRLLLFIAEFIGTWILLFIGCMGCVAKLADGPIPHLQISLTFGLAVMVAVQCIGHISGGHINPVVSVAAAILGYMPLVHVPIYFIAQMLGAIAGYGTLMIVTSGKYLHGGQKNTSDGLVEFPGVCSPAFNANISVFQALGVELLLTFILILVICTFWDWKNANKLESISIKVGLTVVVLAIAGGPYSGCHVNPARSFGPALLNGDWQHHWIYWIGPMAGGIFGALLYRYIFSTIEPKEDVIAEVPPKA